MQPKPLLFPFLYDVQEASDPLTDSTSIYEAPILRERVNGQAENEEHSGKIVDEKNANTVKKPSSIALRNRQLIQGVILRNEFAKLLVETKDGPIWIAKSQIVQIYE